MFNSHAFNLVSIPGPIILTSQFGFDGGIIILARGSRSRPGAGREIASLLKTEEPPLTTFTLYYFVVEYNQSNRSER